MVFEVLFSMRVHVRRVQEGLGRNAPNVQARASEGSTRLDTCRLQSNE
jgi:hypothetical protein